VGDGLIDDAAGRADAPSSQIARLAPRFVVTSSSAAAIAGFAVAIADLVISQDFAPDGAWGVDIEAALVIGFVVGVVFTVSGAGLTAMSHRVRLPRNPAQRGWFVAAALVAATSLVGLIVLATQPRLWPDWPMVLGPALAGGITAALTVRSHPSPLPAETD
jgi:hypothetical protein